MKPSDIDTLCEYTVVSVDDLAIAMKDPQSLITKLDNDLIFKLKVTGPSEFHLGSDFE
jgi:hypothetical protein